MSAHADHEMPEVVCFHAGMPGCVCFECGIFPRFQVFFLYLARVLRITNKRLLRFKSENVQFYVWCVLVCSEEKGFEDSIFREGSLFFDSPQLMVAKMNVRGTLKIKTIVVSC